MVREPVLENNERFVAAIARGDAAAAAGVYAEEASLLPPDAAAIRGRREIERFWRDGIEMGVRAATLETVELERADGLAVEIGRYMLRLEPGGGVATTDVGKYVIVHRRQPDGCWRWAVEIFNADAPA